jgi:hypothetical protein
MRSSRSLILIGSPDADPVLQLRRLLHGVRLSQPLVQGEEAVSWPKGQPWTEVRKAAYVYRPAWNSGKVGVSKETSQKMRERKLGRPRAEITKKKACLACDAEFLMTSNKQKFCSSCLLEGHAGRFDRYSLRKVQFEQMLQEQKGLCKFCRNPETRVRQGVICELSVDHDHKTKVVRGLVCGRCNFALIRNHTIESAEKLLKYLKGDL